MLYSKRNPWTKKGEKSFDVAMGSFDGAECCELVGLFLLSKLKDLDKNMNVGLYRDDGLINCSNLTPRQVELLKKKICLVFKKYNLRITIDANLKTVNFLDITMDLNSELFKPYTKPNDKPLYVNKQSNHPPSIIKKIPLAVNRRLTSISANEEVFRQAAPPYQAALISSGYSHALKFEPEVASSRSKKNRGRKITWFNPPFSANVSTNVGARFLRIVEQCFPPGSPLHKILNRQTIKVSYRCIPNMAQIVSKHNNDVMKKETTENQQMSAGCNCRVRDSCPLSGECLTNEIVYQTTVTNSLEPDLLKRDLTGIILLLDMRNLKEKQL